MSRSSTYPCVLEEVPDFLNDRLTSKAVASGAIEATLFVPLR
ncbi:hypothetical protein ACF3DV_29775 [Chlorogloeopsis fritschii PCC 9212]|nr:hypothetical protein [Chlorogloeopsis fritschii]